MLKSPLSMILSSLLLVLLTSKSQAFMNTAAQRQQQQYVRVPSGVERFMATPYTTRFRATSEEKSNDSSGSGSGSGIVEGVLESIHNSGYQFRLVVVGNGAILETTEALGPVMKSSKSPKTGDTLMTFASTDKSFEFHVNLNKIETVNFVESERPMENGETKVLRICRLMNVEGKSACSLILIDSSEEAIGWFDGMKN